METAHRIGASLDRLATPAFVYDEVAIAGACADLAAIAGAAGCRALYAMKALYLADVVEAAVPPLDGIAASSLFEARVARSAIASRGAVHVTSPGLRGDEIDALAGVCDVVTCNSLSQLDRFKDRLRGRAECGLRVNPQHSVVGDARYDPCRPQSKLGVPLEHLAAVLEETPERLAAVAGLHLHTNCDAEDFTPLPEIVRRLESRLGALLDQVAWVNLGGGYLFRGRMVPAPLAEAVSRLRTGFGVDVLIEPGASLVRHAGYVVASVLDLFTSDGKAIAVLDAGVNHMPEAFEYQEEPDVLGDTADGAYEYVLAGPSCLAGDVFGLYGFDRPLAVGDRVVFVDMGAYSLVKAHAFNGVALPAVYALPADGVPVLRGRFDYRDFARLCGGLRHAAL